MIATVIRLANKHLARVSSRTTEYNRGYISALNDLSVAIRGRPLDVKTCEWEGCSRIFIPWASGKPRRYCSNSHRVMGWRRMKRDITL